MNSFHTPFKLGSLTLPNAIFYAPLAGCSDYPYRQMSAKYRPGLMYCEMVKMDALMRYDAGTFHILDYSPDMHPIGAQICGSKSKMAGQAARLIENLGFDVIDLNCGCPVDKVTKDGSGSGLLKTPELIGEILAEMVAAVKIPVTVKIRMGWDEKTINAESIVKIAEQAGAQAICIHGRTRQQGYSGPANWDIIRLCKQAAKTIHVIGNGDVVDGPSTAKIYQQTKCDAVLIARGTMGQPWIVEDILDHLKGKSCKTRSLETCRQLLYQHFLFTSQYHSNHRLCVDMRRVGCWYLKKSSGTRQFRELISRAQSLKEIEDLILNFPLKEGESEQVREEKQEIDCC